MNILVTNDDGVFCEGIKILADRLARMEGTNVYVVAPDRARSCSGHGLTMQEPVWLSPSSQPGYGRVKEVWECSGTPADCVRSGIVSARRRGIEFGMVCSGINHGSNLGRDVHYSGTISAAMEAVFMKVQAIAFSLCSHSPKHFEAFESVIPQVVEASNGNVPADTLISVNVPDIPAGELRGIKTCSLGPRDYSEECEALSADGGREGCVYRADVLYRDRPDPGWDVSAWRDGWVTVTPIQTMRENARILKLVSSWGLSLEKEAQRV